MIVCIRLLLVICVEKSAANWLKYREKKKRTKKRMKHTNRRRRRRRRRRRKGKKAIAWDWLWYDYDVQRVRKFIIRWSVAKVDIVRWWEGESRYRMRTLRCFIGHWYNTHHGHTFYWFHFAANYDRLTNDDVDLHFSLVVWDFLLACADDTATFKRNMILAFFGNFCVDYDFIERDMDISVETKIMWIILV